MPPPPGGPGEPPVWSPAPPRESRPWWRTTPALVVAAVLVFGMGAAAGAVGTIAAGGFSEGFGSGIGSEMLTYGPGGDLSMFSLAPGQCSDEDIYVSDSVTEATVVDCTTRHQIEVFAVVDAPVAGGGGRISGDDLADFADSACYLSFEPYVGRSYFDSDLAYQPVVPSPAAWREGSRTIHCVLFHVDGDELDGSARDSEI